MGRCGGEFRVTQQVWQAEDCNTLRSPIDLDVYMWHYACYASMRDVIYVQSRVNPG